MATISEFTVGNAITVVITDEQVNIIGTPPGESDKMPAVSPIKAIVSYGSIWTGHLATFTYENRANVVEFSWNPTPVPPPFHHAASRGRLTMKRAGDHFVFPVRALRVNNKTWPTLTQITWDELDELHGDNAKAFFKSLGEVEFGRYGDMTSGAGTGGNAIGARVHVDHLSVIIGIFALTRAVAVLRNFGK